MFGNVYFVITNCNANVSPSADFRLHCTYTYVFTSVRVAHYGSTNELTCISLQIYTHIYIWKVYMMSMYALTIFICTSTKNTKISAYSTVDGSIPALIETDSMQWYICDIISKVSVDANILEKLTKKLFLPS